jgi:hypothetical protein
MSAAPIQIDSETVIARMLRHPRVAYQNIAEKEPELERLRSSIPPLVPYGSNEYAGVLSVLDWDHRLPSKSAILRVCAYYSQVSLRAGEAELAARGRQIQARDKYPEFDVPDYAGLTADELYEGNVTHDGDLSELRLASTWRRDISHIYSRTAVQTTRKSDEFKQVLQEAKSRPDYLGDLEAVSWTPPCETEYQSWTIDVWYLMHLDASVGRGRSFLIDPDTRKVVVVREFVVQSG